MKQINQEYVAVFSAALTQIYSNIKANKKVNMSNICRMYDIKPMHRQFIKKALINKHLINASVTQWNPNYTEPNLKLAEQIILECRRLSTIQAAKSRENTKQKVRINEESKECISPKHLTIEQVISEVKHYGLFKIIWKCLF